jgi:hypothetical protein
MGRSKGIQSLSVAEKEQWYAKVDAIRQARVPKKRALTWLEPSLAEIQEEFA